MKLLIRFILPIGFILLYAACKKESIQNNNVRMRLFQIRDSVVVRDGSNQRLDVYVYELNYDNQNRVSKYITYYASKPEEKKVIDYYYRENIVYRSDSNYYLLNQYGLADSNWNNRTGIAYKYTFDKQGNTIGEKRYRADTNHVFILNYEQFFSYVNGDKVALYSPEMLKIEDYKYSRLEDHDNFWQEKIDFRQNSDHLIQYIETFEGANFYFQYKFLENGYVENLIITNFYDGKTEKIKSLSFSWEKY